MAGVVGTAAATEAAKTITAVRLREPHDDCTLGHSVLTVAAFLSLAECARLIAAAHSVFASYDRAAEPRERLPMAACAEGRRLHSVIIQRLLNLIEEKMPLLACSLFGQDTGLKEMNIRYSSGEPAVNIYTHGGEFAPHTDDEHLTMLIPLDEAFEGGGTAFWEGGYEPPKPAPGGDGLCGLPQPASATDMDRSTWLPPAHVLLKPAGTALLFGGDVTHAGMPVHSGTRHVFVMSFTLSPQFVPRFS